jgi:hypothetical protein
MQVRDRKATERLLVVVQDLTHDSDNLRSLLSPIDDRPTAPGQVRQSCDWAFGPTPQESPAPVQDSLFATAQRFGSSCNRRAPVSQQDDQYADHQPSIFAAFLLRLTQFLLFFAFELDSIFVRFASYGTETSYSDDLSLP